MHRGVSSDGELGTQESECIQIQLARMHAGHTNPCSPHTATLGASFDDPPSHAILHHPVPPKSYPNEYECYFWLLVFKCPRPGSEIHTTYHLVPRHDDSYFFQHALATQTSSARAPTAITHNQYAPVALDMAHGTIPDHNNLKSLKHEGRQTLRPLVYHDQNTLVFVHHLACAAIRLILYQTKRS
jgi:hypothetical protein